MGGTSVLNYFELFVEYCAFPDLTREEAVIDEEYLCDKDKKATLEVEIEINGGNVCYLCLFCTSAAYICLISLPPILPLELTLQNIRVFLLKRE